MCIILWCYNMGFKVSFDLLSNDCGQWVIILCCLVQDASNFILETWINTMNWRGKNIIRLVLFDHVKCTCRKKRTPVLRVFIFFNFYSGFLHGSLRLNKKPVVVVCRMWYFGLWNTNIINIVIQRCFFFQF